MQRGSPRRLVLPGIAVLAAFWLAAPAAQDVPRSDIVGPNPLAANRVAADATGTARISGTVAEPDGAPVRNAAVQLSVGLLRRSAATDAAGRYELGDLPAGEYGASASKSGYLASAYKQSSPFSQGRPLTVADGAVVRNVDFKIYKQAVLAGQVVDDGGDPVARVEVVVLHNTWDLTRLVPSIAGRAMTADDGRFRISGLKPARYVILATPPSPSVGGRASGRTSAVAPTYFPGVLDESAAQPLDVSYGDVRDSIELMLQTASLSRISGTLVDSGGLPLETAAVSVTRRVAVGSSSPSATVITGRGGAFLAADLAPGTYALSALVNRGDSAEPLFASQEISVSGGATESVALMAEPPVVVTGRIVTSPPDAIKQLQPSRPLRVTAIPMSTWYAREGLTRRGATDGTVDAQHAFEFLARKGVARLSVTGLPATWAVESIRIGGTDVTDAPVMFRDRRVSGVEVVVTNQASRLSGVVTASDGSVSRGHAVLVLPQDAGRREIGARYTRAGQTDIDGRYTFNGLPAGDYFIVAVEDLGIDAITDAHYWERLIGRAERFRLRDGERREHNLRSVLLGRAR